MSPMRRIIGGVTPDMVQSVLGRFEGQRTPQHVSLDESRYTQRLFPPGLWCGWHTTDNKYVFLQRVKAIAVTGNTITLNPFMAGIFAGGETLAVLNPDGTPSATTVTVASVDIPGNKLTLSAAVPLNANLANVAITPTKPNGDKLGVLSPNLRIDLNHNYKFGVHTGGTFYRGLMPYLDTELEKMFPLIIYV